MKSGIYQIVNKANGKQYIGSSYNVHTRLQIHESLLRSNKHHSVHLQRAWNKYGAESFEKKVLEYCEESILLEREQHYLNTLLEADKYLTKESNIFVEKGYNICPLSIKGFTGTQSKGSIVKQLRSRGFSEIYQIDLSGNIIKIFDGKFECPDKVGSIYLSIKTGNQLRDKNYGYIEAKNYSDGFKPKQLVVWNKGQTDGISINRKKVFVYNIYGVFVEEFDSVFECAEFFNTDSGNISRKTNQIPKKILIDSLSSKYLITDSKENDQVNLIKSQWDYVFSYMNWDDKLELVDCFDSVIGQSNENQLAELLNVSVASVYSAISRNTRIKSLSVTRI